MLTKTTKPQIKTGSENNASAPQEIEHPVNMEKNHTSVNLIAFCFSSVFYKLAKAFNPVFTTTDVAGMYAEWQDQTAAIMHHCVNFKRTF